MYWQVYGQRLRIFENLGKWKKMIVDQQYILPNQFSFEIVIRGRDKALPPRPCCHSPNSQKNPTTAKLIINQNSLNCSIFMILPLIKLYFIDEIISWSELDFKIAVWRLFPQ